MKKLWSFVKWVPLVLLVGILVGLFAFDGWEDLDHGRKYRLANKMFSVREEIDEVRIYLLVGSDKTSPPGGKFRLGMLGGTYDAFGSVVLKGEEASGFTSLWSGQQPIHSSIGCHEPAYGFRLLRKGRLVREAALCWRCSNFSYPLWPGNAGVTSFDATSEQGIALFEFCTTRLPFEGYEKELQKLRGKR